MSSITTGKPIEVLLVEDNPGDILLIRLVLEEKCKDTILNCPDINLNVVENGIEAIAFLKKQPPYSQTPLPHLVLLDLNLPGKSGYEVLEEIKLDNSLKQIPTIILTSSDRQEDIFKAYSLYANGYISKPIQFDELHKALRALQKFWFLTVKLPGG